VGLSDLTKEAVLNAIAEFDTLHRDEFLKKYGFGRSRGYFLIYNDRRYDSKAIAGAAHGYISDSMKPLRPSEFSGGDKTVARRLRELGFSISFTSSTPSRYG
jgi:5-methylcytosine-specific restriction enzyme A